MSTSEFNYSVLELRMLQHLNAHHSIRSLIKPINFATPVWKLVYLSPKYYIDSKGRLVIEKGSDLYIHWKLNFFLCFRSSSVSLVRKQHGKLQIFGQLDDGYWDTCHNLSVKDLMDNDDSEIEYVEDAIQFIIDNCGYNLDKFGDWKLHISAPDFYRGAILQFIGPLKCNTYVAKSIIKKHSLKKKRKK